MNLGLPQSVQTRLARHAKELDVDPNLVLVRYATERFLYRLSRSQHADRFILKGALLLLVWLGERIRPTRDADLLGFGDLTADDLMDTFTQVCAVNVEPDGMVFDAASIHVAPIRHEDAYGGQRVTLLGVLGKARLRVQVDVGIGDVVVPEPQWIEYPSMLQMPKPRLRAYRPETAIAEKVHAMVLLGSKNSRMRDFFDVHALAAHGSFDGELLARALASTFTRRSTKLPAELPIALSPAFAQVDGKRSQWAGFIRRNRIVAAPPNLDAVIVEIASFVGPIFLAASDGRPFHGQWAPGGPWVRAQTSMAP